MACQRDPQIPQITCGDFARYLTQQRCLRMKSRLLHPYVRFRLMALEMSVGSDLLLRTALGTVLQLTSSNSPQES
jgi:hypothetical protein